MRRLRRDKSRDGWTLKSSSKLCSDHFLEKYIRRDPNKQRVFLTDDAVPTRFKKFPKHFQNQQSRRKSPRKRKKLDETTNSENDDSDTESSINEQDSGNEGSSNAATDASQNVKHLELQLESANDALVTVKKKLKVTQQRARRLEKRLKTSNEVIAELRKNDMISKKAESVLKGTLSDEARAIFERIANGNAGTKGCEFPPELKSFALTLQFYSSKAYDFVRATLNNALPERSTLRKWYGKIPADPGFTQPAFNVLREKVEEKKKDGKDLHCALMLDEMSLRKYVQWVSNQHRYSGFVDLGNELDDDDDDSPQAKDVLVFMVVNVDGNWKVPCAYFFIDGLSGEERANLVRLCIGRLYDVGVNVVSLTCDGPSCHLTMLRSLGATISFPHTIEGSFPHPNGPGFIRVFLDACYMLKLVRNTLGQKKVLVDGSKRKILWQYVIDLQKIAGNGGIEVG